MATVPRRTIGFYVPSGFILLDLSGSLEAFHLANRIRPDSYRLRVVSLDGGLVETSSGLALATEKVEADDVFDTLVVVGGERSIRNVPKEQADFVRAAASDVRRLASVCIGAFVLAAAGLLDGRRATTHWAFAAELKKLYPSVRVDGDRIFTHEDGIWTSAGITAGIDLALALIEEDVGSEVTRSVARSLVVNQRRAGGQMQFSSLLRLDPDSDRIRRVLSYAREHLEESLSVERLAEVASLSPRQFARAFVEATGATPAKVIERLRVEAARPRIEEGREPLETIARSVGFPDADRLRLSFRRLFGKTPRALRRDTRESEGAAQRH